MSLNREPKIGGPLGTLASIGGTLRKLGGQLGTLNKTFNATAATSPAPDPVLEHNQQKDEETAPPWTAPVRRSRLPVPLHPRRWYPDEAIIAAARALVRQGRGRKRWWTRARRRAVQLLLGGASMGEAAKAVGYTRLGHALARDLGDRLPGSRGCALVQAVARRRRRLRNRVKAKG